jgi:tyrosinase
MSKDTQTDVSSFFQIGGIHGLPYVQWDGSGGKAPVAGSWGGYCTHGSMLFPTWHRPYVALFEVRPDFFWTILYTDG